MVYDLYSAAVEINSQHFVLAVTTLIVIVAIIWGICSFLAGGIDPSPKSRKARQLMTDLYVIGTIRKFAEKDGINLQDEMKNLRQIEKWEKASRKSLDSMIETELNEQISAESQKKIESIQGSKESKK